MQEFNPKRPRGRQAPASRDLREASANQARDAKVRKRRQREREAQDLQVLPLPANLGVVADALHRHGHIASPSTEDRVQLGESLGRWLPALFAMADGTYPQSDVTRDVQRRPNRFKPATGEKRTKD